MPIEKAKSQKPKAKKSGIKVFKSLSGFTFIELLVVISLMAIVAVSVSAAYLNFERNQRINEAAMIVKSAVRQVQNNATSGRNNATGCSGSYLLGWDLVVTKTANSLSGHGLCGDGTSDFVTPISAKFPQGVTVQDILYGGTSIGGTLAYILYRPVQLGASFHSASTFLDANGNLINLLGAQPQSNLTVRLVSGSGTLDVVINPGGGAQ